MRLRYRSTQRHTKAELLSFANGMNLVPHEPASAGLWDPAFSVGWWLVGEGDHLSSVTSWSRAAPQPSAKPMSECCLYASSLACIAIAR